MKLESYRLSLQKWVSVMDDPGDKAGYNAEMYHSGSQSMNASVARMSCAAAILAVFGFSAISALAQEAASADQQDHPKKEMSFTERIKAAAMAGGADTNKVRLPESSQPSVEPPKREPDKVFLNPSYVASIQPADFLEGNCLVGTFVGFEAEFAKFRRADSKQVIYIPKSAILYFTAKERFVNY